jgi:hypothetical protein
MGIWPWIIYPAGSIALGYATGWVAAHAVTRTKGRRDMKAWMALGALGLGALVMYCEFISFAGMPLTGDRALSYLFEGAASAFAFTETLRQMTKSAPLARS